MYQVNNPSIIDLEASGFGSESYPIEVGFVLNDGKKFCTLISPAPGWTHWDTKAEAIHHISKEILNTNGKPVEQVAAELNSLLSGRILYSDGWVVDKPWLTTLFYAAKMPMEFSVSPLEMILTEEQMQIWHDTKNRVETSLNLERHRASNDALIIQETFKQSLQGDGK